MPNNTNSMNKTDASYNAKQASTKQNFNKNKYSHPSTTNNKI